MADNSNKNAANSQFRKLRQAEEGKRAMLDYENKVAAMRAKTTRLRALRLARDAELAASAAAAPPAVKKKAAKKREDKTRLERNSAVAVYPHLPIRACNNGCAYGFELAIGYASIRMTAAAIPTTTATPRHQKPTSQ